jgi:hypothetical protein
MTGAGGGDVSLGPVLERCAGQFAEMTIRAADETVGKCEDGITQRPIQA